MNNFVRSCIYSLMLFPQQKTVSCNSQESAKKIESINKLESAHGNPVKHEKKKSESLIDFSTEFEPPDSATMSQSQHVSSYENISSQALIETSNKENLSHGPNANTFETFLFDQPSASLVTDSGFSWQQTTTSIGAPKDEVKYINHGFLHCSSKFKP